MTRNKLNQFAVITCQSGSYFILFSAFALQTGGKFRRQFEAACTTFQDLCSYQIICHENLYTLTHTRTFIDEQDAHKFNNCLSRHLYFLLSLLIFSRKTFISSS